MKHEFTDTQLRQAVAYFLEGEAVDLGTCTLGEFFWTQQVKALRKMLDALPEPATDDWEECRFEDIQKGDRVRLVCKPGPLEVAASVVEVEPLVVQNHYITWARGNNLGVIESSDVQAVYRIPAPVRHPDPAEHPVILVNESVNTAYDPPEPMIWDGGDFYESPKGSLHINTITKFTPAKVVEDDR